MFELVFIAILSTGAVHVNPFQSGAKFKSFIEKEIQFHSMFYALNSSKYSVPVPKLSNPECAAKWNQSSISVFYLGDSVNRGGIIHFCAHRNATAKEWAKNFSYSGGSGSSKRCVVGNVRLGMLNLYGSNRTGPYFKGVIAHRGDPHADTEQRIHYGLSQYMKTFEIPDIVFIKTDLWDWQVRTPDDVHDMMHRVINNYRIAIEQIRKISPTSVIGVLTSPQGTRKYDLSAFVYQNLLRYLTHMYEDVFVLDWNLLLYNQLSNYLQSDGFHPAKEESIKFNNLFVASLEKYLNITC